MRLSTHPVVFALPLVVALWPSRSASAHPQDPESAVESIDALRADLSAALLPRFAIVSAPGCSVRP